jgi:hypothetical protein
MAEKRGVSSPEPNAGVGEGDDSVEHATSSVAATGFAAGAAGPARGDSALKSVTGDQHGRKRGVG